MMLQLCFLESSIAWGNLLIYQILFTSFPLKKKKNKKNKMSFILDAYCNLDMPFTFFYLKFGLAQGAQW